MGWWQPHQAIRQEINTAVGTAPAAEKVLITGLSGIGKEIMAVTWGDTSKIY